MTVNKQPPTPTQKVAVWKIKYPFLKQLAYYGKSILMMTEVLESLLM